LPDDLFLFAFGLRLLQLGQIIRDLASDGALAIKPYLPNILLPVGIGLGAALEPKVR
jgi:hypothetical protein